jgi:hypothetical protein
MYRYFLDFCSCRVFGATYAVRFTLVGNVIQLSTVVIMCVYSGDLSAHLFQTGRWLPTVSSCTQASQSWIRVGGAAAKPVVISLGSQYPLYDKL